MTIQTNRLFPYEVAAPSESENNAPQKSFKTILKLSFQHPII